MPPGASQESRLCELVVRYLRDDICCGASVSAETEVSELVLDAVQQLRLFLALQGLVPAAAVPSDPTTFF